MSDNQISPETDGLEPDGVDRPQPRLICDILLGRHAADPYGDTIFPELGQLASLIDVAEKTAIIGVGPETAARLGFPSREKTRPLIKSLCSPEGRPRWIELHGHAVNCGMLAMSSAGPSKQLEFIRMAFWCQYPGRNPVFLPVLARFNPNMIRRSATRGLLKIIGGRPSPREEFSRAITLYETDGTRKILQVSTSRHEYRAEDAARFGVYALDVAYACLNYLICPPRNADSWFRQEGQSTPQPHKQDEAQSC